MRAGMNRSRWIGGRLIRVGRWVVDLDAEGYGRINDLESDDDRDEALAACRAAGLTVLDVEEWSSGRVALRVRLPA